jgi:hypothetical protein
MTDDVITAPIRDFCRRSGISRTQVYRMLDRGLLESVKIDDMRLIVLDSYRKLLDRSRVPPKQHASPGDSRRGCGLRMADPYRIRFHH